MWGNTVRSDADTARSLTSESESSFAKCFCIRILLAQSVASVLSWYNIWYLGKHELSVSSGSVTPTLLAIADQRRTER